MTAPIQEPSTGRAIQGLAYQRDQLLRRPGPPPSAAGPISFANTVSGAPVSFGTISTSVPISIAFFTTNDATAFDLGTEDIGGTDYDGVRFLKNGVYLMWSHYGIFNAGAGDNIDCVFLAADANADGPYINSKRGQAPTPGFPTNFLEISWMEAFQVDASGNPPPSDPRIPFCRNNSSGTGTFNHEAFYIYLGAGVIF